MPNLAQWRTKLLNSKFAKLFTLERTLIALLVAFIAAFGWSFYQQNQLSRSYQELLGIQDNTQAELDTLKNQDQYLRNEALQAEIDAIQETFGQTITSYEEILKLRDEDVNISQLETDFATIVTLLAERNYASASAQLAELDEEISVEQAKLAAAVAPIPETVPVVNEAPAAGGYRQQAVATEHGTFLVDVIAAELGSTRVVVETASEGDCADNCPVDSLASFVARAGGYAGINGPYFCPAEYPSCAGKTNSFDTLLMNRHKVYFNSDNNVYSTVPAAIFSGSSARFVGQSSQWGRDTGPDSVIASQPMVLSGGNVAFGGDGDPKKGSRGSRSFIGAAGSTVYIGVVRGATVAEVGHVLKAMGLENALNLDSGGSTALYLNGRYLAGPGRNTPYGIVFVR